MPSLVSGEQIPGSSRGETVRRVETEGDRGP